MCFAISYLSSLVKRAGPFIWTSMNSLYPGMLCAKFGWNWPSGSGKKIYAPEIEDSEDREAYCPVCHFVILFSSLKLSVGTLIFETVTLTLEIDPFFENYNFANNFWTVNARALIFHMSISCDKTFLLVLVNLLTLTFDFLNWRWS